MRSLRVGIVVFSGCFVGFWRFSPILVIWAPLGSRCVAPESTHAEARMPGSVLRAASYFRCGPIRCTALASPLCRTSAAEGSKVVRYTHVFSWSEGPSKIARHSGAQSIHILREERTRIAEATALASTATATSSSNSHHCLIQLPEAVETPAAPTPPPPNHPFHSFCFAVSGANCDTNTSGDDAGSQWITRTTGSTGRQKLNRQEQLQKMSQAEKMQAQEHEEEQSSDLEVRRFPN